MKCKICNTWGSNLETLRFCYSCKSNRNPDTRTCGICLKRFEYASLYELNACRECNIKKCPFCSGFASEVLYACYDCNN